MATSEERKRLREAIAARPHLRHRLSPERRARATAYARRRKAEGATASSIADELGVSQPTVGHWLAGGRSGALVVAGRIPTRSERLREVVVDERRVSALRIVSPAGYRLEGLSLEEAAMVLRALG